jgi:hypothetical protein
MARFEHHLHLPVAVRDLDDVVSMARQGGTTASAVVRDLLRAAARNPTKDLRSVPIAKVPAVHRLLHVRLSDRDVSTVKELTDELEVTEAALVRGLIRGYLAGHQR